MTCCIVLFTGATNVKAECDDWCRFAQGYTDAGGQQKYLENFITWVLPCEGRKWSGYDGYNGYYTRAQFSIDTWYKVSRWLRSVGVYPDYNDAYVTGLGVGWWAQQANPASQWGAWYGCPHPIRD